ncbi:MAG TPA: hypothetical protein VJ650_18275 [Gemmatimonadaceae bacterium]|nr:hypothetical protein [Gemmatimonadaceae bacterium]
MIWREQSPLLLATSLFLGLGIVLLWPIASAYAREFWLVDQCLSLGGSFDYARMTCDLDETHAYIPFASRHNGIAMRFAVGLALLGAAGYTHVAGTVTSREISRPAL